MSGINRNVLYKRIAYVLMLIVFLLAITLDVDTFYVLMLITVQFGLGLYLNWDDLCNYKAQSPLQKLWLRFVVIGSIVIFFSMGVFIIAVIFGYYQL